MLAVMASAKTCVPVIVIAGFLGSGKTTLLNHLLHNSAGVRVGVVVNDFGSINIDAMLVAGQVDAMVSLGNGCLCCALDDNDMDDLLERLTRPGARIDVIAIEASGLAEPPGIIRRVLYSSNPRITYGGLVQVVDGAEFDGTRERHPELDRHLRFADLVVVNKTDRIDEATRQRVLETIDGLCGGTPVLPTSHGRVDPELLFDRQPRSRPTAGEQLSFDQLLAEDRDRHEDHHEHVHDQYVSVEFTSDEPLHPLRLLDFLDNRPAGLYRAKGFVYFGLPEYQDRFTMHTVGGHIRFERSRWSGREPRRTQLVLIGTGIDPEAVTKRLDECVEPDPTTVDPQTMLSILRYIDA